MFGRGKDMQHKRIKRQKGAAMVSVLLLSLLLLAVCGAIILISGMSRSTTVDAVSERKAFDAASAGMQIALSALRGNNAGADISFKAAATRWMSNKADDWLNVPRMSNWLNYSYPATNPDRVPLTSPYDPNTGLAYSVSISAPDIAVPGAVVTPNPLWVDGPVTKPVPPVKPPKPAWHPWNCAHCSWDYTHCSLYNPPNNGTLRADGFGCRHKHCIPPANWGESGGDDGYQRIIVKVVGYGPNGARKELEALVRRTTFIYNAEGDVYIQGADDGTALSMPLSGTPTVTFDSGDQIAFVTTNPSDQTTLDGVIAAVDKVQIIGKGDDYEILDNINERPQFFRSVEEARLLVADLKAEATLRGRYFTSYPASGNAGTDSAPLLTFVDGDAVINSAGSGILVVTGNVQLRQTYHGLVMILGAGKLDLTLAGVTGTIEGGTILAKFGSTGGFQPVEIPIASTGHYTIKSNKTRVTNNLEVLDVHVLAVRSS